MVVFTQAPLEVALCNFDNRLLRFQTSFPSKGSRHTFNQAHQKYTGITTMSNDPWRSLEIHIRFLFQDISAELSSRDWQTPPRPWSDFFDKFTSPKKDYTVIFNRLVTNSHAYQGNYALIFVAALLYYVLCHPAFLFLFGGIIVLWVYATSSKPLVISGRRITRSQRLRAVTVLSALSLILSGALMSFWKVFSIASVLVLLHACFKHTSIRHKLGDVRSRLADQW